MSQAFGILDVIVVFVNMFFTTLLVPFCILMILVLYEYFFHDEKSARKLVGTWKETLIRHPYKNLPELILTRLAGMKHEIYHYFSRRKEHFILLMVLACSLNIALGYVMNYRFHAHIISHWASIGIWIGLLLGQSFQKFRTTLFERIVHPQKFLLEIFDFAFGFLAWFLLRAIIVAPWILGNIKLDLGGGLGLGIGAYAGLVLGLKPGLMVKAGVRVALLAGMLLGLHFGEKTAILFGLCFWRAFHDPVLQSLGVGWSVCIQPLLLVLLSEILSCRFANIPKTGAGLLTISFFMSTLLLWFGGNNGQPVYDPLNSLNLSQAGFNFIAFIMVDHLLTHRKENTAGWQILLWGSSLVLLNYLLACSSLWLGLIPDMENPWNTILSNLDIRYIASIAWTPKSPYFLIFNAILLPTMLMILLLSFFTLSKFVTHTIIADRLDKLTVIKHSNCFKRLMLFCCVSFLLIAFFHDGILALSDSMTQEKFQLMSRYHWFPSVNTLSEAAGLIPVLLKGLG